MASTTSLPPGEDAVARWRRIGSLALKGAGGEPVDLARALSSHGVASLLPQHVDPVARRLETTLALEGTAYTICLRPGRSTSRSALPTVAVDALDLPSSRQVERRLVDVARHLLSLDEDLARFYELAAGDPALAWTATGAGRMLRGPTVFEDVVKTICTTNCSWSATVRMVTSIVEELGPRSPDGRPAFPDAAAMASASDDFYRGAARAGYRGPYLRRLASDVAEGRLDLEELHDDDLPDEEVTRRLLALPGVGPYAAAHVMLISLGRYRPLVLDSWTRPTYARLVGRVVTDRSIERRFRRFGDYAGLAFWLFVTRDWIED